MSKLLFSVKAHLPSINNDRLLNRLSCETIQLFGMVHVAGSRHDNQWKIPIHDAVGNAIGEITIDCSSIPLGYRYVGDGRCGDVLFNIHRVLHRGINNQDLTITEDLVDCIKLWQAGEHQIVSILGSNLSVSQNEMIFGLIAPQRIRFVPASWRSRSYSSLKTVGLLASKAHVRTVGLVWPERRNK